MRQPGAERRGAWSFVDGSTTNDSHLMECENLVSHPCQPRQAPFRACVAIAAQLRFRPSEWLRGDLGTHLVFSTAYGPPYLDVKLHHISHRLMLRQHILVFHKHSMQSGSEARHSSSTRPHQTLKLRPEKHQHGCPRRPSVMSSAPATLGFDFSVDQIYSETLDGSQDVVHESIGASERSQLDVHAARIAPACGFRRTR